MTDAHRIAIVTGAAGGIGAATAELFAKSGIRVISVDRSSAVEDTARKTREISGVGEARVVDLSDLDAAEQLVTDIGGRHGRIDILVNNAAIHPKNGGRRQAVQDTSIEQWNAVMAINLAAPFVLCKAVIPFMRRGRWGRIINVASRAGRTYSPDGGAHYAASKAGLIGFTRILAGEIGPDGITANCITPGRVATPLSNSGMGKQLHKEFASTVPVRRVGTPEEVAFAILHFASEQAGYTTGAIIDINGGVFMP